MMTYALITRMVPNVNIANINTLQVTFVIILHTSNLIDSLPIAAEAEHDQRFQVAYKQSVKSTSVGIVFTWRVFFIWKHQFRWIDTK